MDAVSGWMPPVTVLVLYVYFLGSFLAVYKLIYSI